MEHLTTVLITVQWGATVLWAGTLPMVAASAWRWIVGSARDDDGYRAVLFFVAVTMLGYSARATIFPRGDPSMDIDTLSLIVMRLLSTLCAVFAIRVSRGHRHAAGATDAPRG